MSDHLSWALESGAVKRLDERWKSLNTSAPTDAFKLVSSLQAEGLESEIVVLGGGLGLLAATALQARGHQVTLIDRTNVGDTHREWNSSQAELEVLKLLGLPFENVVAKTYRTGFVEFAYDDPQGIKPARSWIPGVLDVAVSSQSLLTQTRSRFLALGGTLREGETFKHLEIGTSQTRIITDTATYRAKLVLDAMGVLSPIQFQLHQKPFDWVCPTVGSVVKHLEGVDENIGEVLVTDRGGDDQGRQLIWELFPLEDHANAVYLFHYAPIGQEGTLEGLFADYFKLLPEYHDDTKAEHVKPVFGYIPSRHKRRSSSLPRVVAIGDAGAWNNPLTFTGFGSNLRNLPRVLELLEFALKFDTLKTTDTIQIGARQSNLELLSWLTRFMRPLKHDPQSVNRIFNAFVKSSNRTDPARVKRFYKDQSSSFDFVTLMLGVMLEHPSIWRHGFEQLGMGELVAFLSSPVVSMAREAKSWAADVLWETVKDRLTPSQALAWQAAALEWQAMRGIAG
jgi:lycopene cyclase CruA